MNFAKFLKTPFLLNTSGGCFCVFGDPGYASDEIVTKEQYFTFHD